MISFLLVTSSARESVPASAGHKGSNHIRSNENAVDEDLEGFGRVCPHLDVDCLPSFSFSLNKGALLGNGFVTVHVKVDLFRAGSPSYRKLFVRRLSYSRPYSTFSHGWRSQSSVFEAYPSTGRTAGGQMPKGRQGRNRWSTCCRVVGAVYSCRAPSARCMDTSFACGLT
jgi:hypothetical protein